MSEILIYQNESGNIKVDVRFEDGSIWLSQAQICELFGKAKSTISEHIKAIFEEEELNPISTVRNYRTVQKEGIREVERDIEYYNLDMIIAIGFRVRSSTGTKFRIWANDKLKEYITKGFVLNDERFKNGNSMGYFDELQKRLRDIRISEKFFYQKIKDIYMTSIDYDPKDEKTIEFFKIVQNKLHYATHGHTASEVIYERADSEKPFMGLTTFKGDIPVLQDVVIAKNYLNEEELKILNNLVSGYFDFAEIQAIRHNPMYMKDYIKQLDMILSSTGEKMLNGSGSISHKKAIQKAKAEYRKYQVKTISPVEEEYLNTIKEINNKIEKKEKNV